MIYLFEVASNRFTPLQAKQNRREILKSPSEEVRCSFAVLKSQNIPAKAYGRISRFHDNTCLNKAISTPSLAHNECFLYLRSMRDNQRETISTLLWIMSLFIVRNPFRSNLPDLSRFVFLPALFTPIPVSCRLLHNCPHYSTQHVQLFFIHTCAGRYQPSCTGRPCKSSTSESRKSQLSQASARWFC